MSRRTTVLRLAGALAVMLSAVTLVWNAASTSSARVSATTSGTSFFTTGVVDLAQPNSVVELLFDADGLYPGLDVSGCVEIEYRGSIPASVRLHAAHLGGSGLEAFVELRVTTVAAETCADAEESLGTVAFAGPLPSLWSDHPDYDRALVLRPEMVAGERVVIIANATVVDDNQAQGLGVDFAFTVEARP